MNTLQRLRDFEQGNIERDKQRQEQNAKTFKNTLKVARSVRDGGSRVYNAGGAVARNLNPARGWRARGQAQTDASNTISSGLRTLRGYCAEKAWTLVCVRLLCIPCCLLLFILPIMYAAKVVDDSFPLVGDIPASANELGFAASAFVHLYWPPAPPPAG